MNVSTTFPQYYPAETFFCFLHLNNNNCLEVLPSYSLNNEWGESSIIQSCDIELSSVKKVDLVWLSLCEQKFYSVDVGINFNLPKGDFQTILIGMMPHGRLILWLYGQSKSEIVGRFIGEEVEIEMEDFLPDNPSLRLADYCMSRIESETMVKNHYIANGVHSITYFDSYMKTFFYRYSAQFQKLVHNKWIKYSENEIIPIFDYIEEALYDGTHDKLHNGELMKYHEAGKPKKLRVQWYIGKSEYSAYFWFEDERIREVFDKFYGAHPDTKTDFIIRIDTEKKKYELALYRYGLKEPQIISEDVYQLLVFKNKFEDYRSENYNQECGAWIW